MFKTLLTILTTGRYPTEAGVYRQEKSISKSRLEKAELYKRKVLNLPHHRIITQDISDEEVLRAPQPRLKKAMYALQDSFKQ